MLSQELIKLYNTLALIETKGESTKLMAQCMVFVEQLASQVNTLEKQNEKEQNQDVEKEEDE